jgi:phage terminase Nu1 subunit (DNA packaging protein)
MVAVDERFTRIVSRKDLARLLDISLPTVYAWIDAGMPAVEEPQEDEKGKRTGEWRFDLAAVVCWREHEIARATKKYGLHYVRTVILSKRTTPGGSVWLADLK